MKFHTNHYANLKSATLLIDSSGIAKDEASYQQPYKFEIKGIPSLIH